MIFTTVRVDDRLIHGQVVVGWTRTAGITHILVADDKTANDPVQCSLLKMVTPVGIRSDILTVDKAVTKIESGVLKKYKSMLLVSGPETLVRLMDKGVEISDVNIGNVRSTEGRQKVLSHMYASAEEIGFWRELDNRGVRLTGQILPDQPKSNLNEILNKMD